MSQLVVHQIVPTDAIDVVATHPDSGRPVRRTTWSGVVAVAPDADGQAIEGAVSVFLPDSRPFPKLAMTGVRVAARAALAGVPPSVVDGARLEVERASATISPDPRGGEHAWVELHLQVRAAGLTTDAPWRLAYQVDLVVPHRPT